MAVARRTDQSPRTATPRTPKPPERAPKPKPGGDEARAWTPGAPPLRLRVTLDFEQWLGRGKALASVRAPKERDVFRAKVALDGGDLEAKVRLRGQSSLQELTYPKLKVDLQGDAKGTPLVGVREFSLNTHGFDAQPGATSSLGRLRSPEAVAREAAIYALAETLGFTVRGHRLAEVEYRDEGSRRTVRGPGLLLEDVDALAKRLGLAEVELGEGAAPKGQVPRADAARLALFQTLIGNWDWSLGRDLSDVHNLSLLARRGGTLVPVLEDFDLCGAVTGAVRDTPQMTDQFFPRETPVARAMLWTLVTELRTTFTPDELATAVKALRAQAPALRRFLEVPRADDAGQALLREHAETFLRLLDAGAWLEVPLTRAATGLSKTPGGPPVADVVARAPVELLERKGEWARVSPGFRTVARGAGKAVTEGWVPLSALEGAR